MSLVEIEAELRNLSPEELRSLALKSWTAFVEKEGSASFAHQCNENDPELLAALDEALEKADVAAANEYSAHQLRERLDKWTSR